MGVAFMTSASLLRHWVFSKSEQRALALSVSTSLPRAPVSPSCRTGTAWPGPSCMTASLGGFWPSWGRGLYKYVHTHTHTAYLQMLVFSMTI